MTGNRKRKRGSLLIRLGSVMIIAAVFLTGWNMYQQSAAGQTANTILKELAPEIDEKNRELAGSAAGSNGRYAGEFVTPDYVLNPAMDMPTVNIGGSSYIGTLSIPALDVELPVMEDWNYSNLRKAPCRYAGTAYQDDMVICAHNYDTHFGGIKELSQGDIVNFTDVDGNVFTYRVSETEILRPYDCERMKTGSWDLTMFTCTVGGATRVTVRCQRV